jgi:hypothetical protein
VLEAAHVPHGSYLVLEWALVLGTVSDPLTLEAWMGRGLT